MGHFHSPAATKSRRSSIRSGVFIWKRAAGVRPMAVSPIIYKSAARGVHQDTRHGDPARGAPWPEERDQVHRADVAFIFRPFRRGQQSLIAFFGQFRNAPLLVNSD